MKKLTLALIITLFCSCLVQAQQIQSTYYLIRHAEKMQDSGSDPDLTEEGKQRAATWAEVLSQANLDMVYSTDYKRTKNTATPSALKNGLVVTIYDPRNFDIEAFKKETMGKTVLVVGHSNTIPALANGLIGDSKYKDIDHHNNANLYIIDYIGDLVLDKLLQVD